MSSGLCRPTRSVVSEIISLRGTDVEHGTYTSVCVRHILSDSLMSRTHGLRKKGKRRCFITNAASEERERKMKF